MSFYCLRRVTIRTHFCDQTRLDVDADSKEVRMKTLLLHNAAVTDLGSAFIFLFICGSYKKQLGAVETSLGVCYKINWHLAKRCFAVEIVLT